MWLKTCWLCSLRSMSSTSLIVYICCTNKLLCSPPSSASLLAGTDTATLIIMHVIYPSASCNSCLYTISSEDILIRRRYVLLVSSCSSTKRLGLCSEQQLQVSMAVISHTLQKFSCDTASCSASASLALHMYCVLPRMHKWQLCRAVRQPTAQALTEQHGPAGTATKLAGIISQLSFRIGRYCSSQPACT